MPFGNGKIFDNSEWGSEFRPEYRKIGKIRDLLSNVHKMFHSKSQLVGSMHGPDGQCHPSRSGGYHQNFESRNSNGSFSYLLGALIFCRNSTVLKQRSIGLI